MRQRRKERERGNNGRDIHSSTTKEIFRKSAGGEEKRCRKKEKET